MSRTSTQLWSLALTAVAFFMVNLDALVVITALPAIHDEFHVDIATLQWSVNAYTLAFAAFIIPAAALADRFGRRRLFAIGVALFATASAACAVAPNITALVAARAGQGIASGVVMPLSLTILTNAFPAERRGAVIGILSAVAGLAVAIGPLVGGAITQTLSWHWIFWINVPIGAVATVAALKILKESFGASTRLDLFASGLIAAGAATTVLGLVRAAESGWGSAQTILTLTVGVLLMAAFIGWERRTSEPMLPIRLFRNPTFSAGNATGFFMTGALFASVFLVSQYFQLALGRTPLETGLMVLPWSTTPLIVAPLAGIASDRLGRRPLMVGGMLLQGGGLLVFALLVGATLEYWALVLPLVVAGVGISMVLPAAPSAVLGAVAPAEIGKASGVQSMLQRFGSAFGVAIATAVFASNGSLATQAAFVAGFRPALIVVAALSMLGALAAMGVQDRRQVQPQLAAKPAGAAATESRGTFRAPTASINLEAETGGS